MDKKIVITDKVEYKYPSHSEDRPATIALKGISIGIEKGQFVVVIGRNGSGKSTFARLLNALLIPTQGTVYINGIDTREEENLWEIRRASGMVFQNPDNQIIGTTVEEDAAFGPENLGIPPHEIIERVNEALKSVGMEDYAQHAPHLLSGGQKQRVSIAGVLAMKPECIILDEATAMLDPAGRREVLAVIRRLNKEEGITVILITHHMEEAIMADRVIVVDCGKVVLDGVPKEVFTNVEIIKEMGLDIPQISELFHELYKKGCRLSCDILDIDEAVEEIVQLFSK